MALPLPTAALLPLEPRIPSRREDGRTRPLADDATPWTTPYVSRYVALPGADEHRAWLHFCLGHHVEFLYWQVTVDACERVTGAARAGDRATAARAMDDVARLVRGSGALLHYCAAFKPELYDPCLRDAMRDERDDFSGDMSRDFLAMMRAKAAMVEALDAEPGLGHARQAFRAAERAWHLDHGQVILALHPGKSLLREKVEALRAEADGFDYRAYVDQVVRGAEALDDYDDLFGVARTTDLTIEAYWAQAVAKLAQVHNHLGLGGAHRLAILHGDATLLRLVSEAAARPGP